MNVIEIRRENCLVLKDYDADLFFRHLILDKILKGLVVIAIKQYQKIMVKILDASRILPRQTESDIKQKKLFGNG